MSAADRFDPEALIDQAREWAGSDDFGTDFDENETWRDGLGLLCDGVRRGGSTQRPRRGDRGAGCGARVEESAAGGGLAQVLIPRSPRRRSSRPIFIVGQPRTGTTILFDLLAQDPALRPPLTWEVDAPLPVPRPDTYETDPRIAETQATLEMSEQIIPGFMSWHPMGAQVGQECVRITASQFCSMIFSVQYRLPTYYKWLLYEADHRHAYRYHRIFLQHLQSGVSGQWLLKSPAHLWTLDSLVETYPDAVIVQTHRDPLKVISSISALTNHLRRMASDETSIADCAQQSCEEIVVGLQRGMTLREALPPGQVIDVQFADFMRDPFATIRSLYGRLDRELTPVAEQRMREHLAAHPGDGGGGRYSWADTGLDAEQLREQVSRLPGALRRSHRVAEIALQAR